MQTKFTICSIFQRKSGSRRPDSRQSSSRRPDSRQSRTGNKPQSNGNVKGSLKDSDIKENPAFKKYLKLKERQRKLRVLRSGLVDSTESDELSDIVMDHMSETRSVMSLVSQSQGESSLFTFKTEFVPFVAMTFLC